MKYSTFHLQSPFPNNSILSQTKYLSIISQMFKNQFKKNISLNTRIDDIRNEKQNYCSELISDYWIADMKWKSGLGYMIRNLAIDFLEAIANEKIFIWSLNLDKWPFRNSSYCSSTANVPGMECYFQPITNCMPIFRNIVEQNNQRIKYSKHNGLPMYDKYDKMKLFWAQFLPNLLPTARWSYKQFNVLLMCAEWFLFFRYNQRTQSVIAHHIYAIFSNTFEMKDFLEIEDLQEIHHGKIYEKFEKYFHNNVISLAMRNSDKCFPSFEDKQRKRGAEMVCFNITQYEKVLNVAQVSYKNSFDMKYIIVTSENSRIISDFIEYKNRNERKVNIIVNANDMKPESGQPLLWNENTVQSNIDSDLMISMLVALHMNVMSKYWVFTSNSNWHLLFNHIRQYLGHRNLSLPFDSFSVHMTSYCSPCKNTKHMNPKNRRIVLHGVEMDSIANDDTMRVLNETCVKWQYFESRNMLSCYLTYDMKQTINSH